MEKSIFLMKNIGTMSNFKIDLTPCPKCKCTYSYNGDDMQWECWCVIRGGRCFKCENYSQKLIGPHIHHFCKLSERQDGYLGVSALEKNCKKGLDDKRGT